MAMTLDLWKGIQESTKVMLSSYGKNNFYSSPDLGSITISDEPERLDRVASYIEDLNKDLSKQVTLNIVVYNVEIDEKDTVGVDWSSVWNSAASKVGLSLGGLTNTTGLQNAGLNILKGDMADSKFILGALNQVGKTSLVTRGQVMTMNRQTAPLQVVDETTYLAKITTTVSGTSGAAQQSLEPGTVISGFSTMVTPKIEDDGDVLLQFSGGISDLKALTSFSVGGNTIQLPQKSIRDFLQRVKLKSGETLVLAGFEQSADRSNDQGVGHSKNIFMGGKQFANAKRTSVVVLVTPRLAE
jgi:type IVB pilus formation R64 PilN family outer membrane protein